MSLYENSALSYSDKMSFLESQLNSINNNYYGGSNDNSMNTYMYLSTLSNSSNYSPDSSRSSYRGMSRTPDYNVGQWSISGMF